MFNCIDSEINPKDFDTNPFKFKHKMLGHEALSLDNLSKVLVNLPQDQVMYSKGLSDLNTNFDRAHIEQSNNMSIEETIENIKTSSSYIMVKSPETDPSFKDLHQSLVSDVNQVMMSKGVGKNAIEPKLFLFIASPNAKTPFHIDRYSTFLFQFRGSKTVAVYDQFDEKIVPAEIRENFASYGPQRPQWSEETDSQAQKFHFTPGEALHIPFIAGHYIQNGAEDVSISMSIIFRTNESQTWLDAMAVNNSLRAKLGMNVTPVGQNFGKDKMKANMLPILNGVNGFKNIFR